MEQSKFYQIKNVTECEYTLVGCDGSLITRSIQEVDKIASAFTIQDAKDGDVLSQDGIPFIFKSWDNNCIAYCGITGFGLFKVVKDYFSWCNGINVTPATKEQRELLFQKMKEAGYEWDSEKKELMKIKQKHDDSLNEEDYGIDGLWHAQRILEKTLGEVDGYQTDDGILEHKCAIAAVKKLSEQKPSWNEEDEKMYNMFRSMAHGTYVVQTQETIDSLLSWLKSIKPNHWKPSEEQMEALDKAKDSPANYYNIRLGLQSLYNDLLKL